MLAFFETIRYNNHCSAKWTVSSAGRASAWRAEGHRFESCTVHHIWRIRTFFRLERRSDFLFISKTLVFDILLNDIKCQEPPVLRISTGGSWFLWKRRETLAGYFSARLFFAWASMSFILFSWFTSEARGHNQRQQYLPADKFFSKLL